MPSKLIKLGDGTYIEIEIPNAQHQSLVGSSASKIAEGKIDSIKPMILKIAKPLAEVYQELNKNMEVKEAELEMGLAFEAEGNIYVTKAKTNANIVIKLRIAPKIAEDIEAGEQSSEGTPLQLPLATA